MYCEDQYIAPICVVVNRMGLEPMTPTVKVLCSTC